MLINPIETFKNPTPLHYAAEQGKLAVCKELISNGANVNTLDYLKRTPLHYAAKQGKLAVCEQLISNGANVNALDCCNVTPLHYAAYRGKLAVCKQLISNGANVNTLDNLKRTPLHDAAHIGSVDVCKLLISNGANINASNCFNRTPLMLSTNKKHVAVTEYFLENKAVLLKEFDFLGSQPLFGHKTEKDMYLSMLTWLVKQRTLEVAQTRNWFWKLCSLAFKKTNTLKSICRNLIRKDASHVQVCYNFEGFNIPEVLKNYLEFKEELQILFGLKNSLCGSEEKEKKKKFYLHLK